MFGEQSKEVRGTISVKCSSEDVLVKLNNLISSMTELDIDEFYKALEQRFEDYEYDEIEANQIGTVSEGRRKLKIKSSNDKKVIPKFDSIGSLEI